MLARKPFLHAAGHRGSHADFEYAPTRPLPPRLSWRRNMTGTFSGNRRRSILRVQWLRHPLVFRSDRRLQSVAEGRQFAQLVSDIRIGEDADSFHEVVELRLGERVDDRRDAVQRAVQLFLREVDRDVELDLAL